MVHINWKRDYKGEFLCPNCENSSLSIAGFDGKKKRFSCRNCNIKTVSHLNLESRSQYVESHLLKNKGTDWKKEYKGDFICPSCEKSPLSLSGTQNGIRKFHCCNCHSYVLAYLSLKSCSKYSETRLRDERIDWEREYQGEFICPDCEKDGMIARGIHKGTEKREFYCSGCRKRQKESCDIGEIKEVEDPLNSGCKWYTNHRIQGFICPNCQEENMYFERIRINRKNKKVFKCRSCGNRQHDSITLVDSNLTHYSNNGRPIKLFEWLNEKWDLRMINNNFDERDVDICIANFADFKSDWFESEVKKYIYSLCQVNTPFGTIKPKLSSLRTFSRYLFKENIMGFHQIDRSIILDYLSKENKVTKHKLGTLRDFFTLGTIKGWFDIDRDIIRSADYPKIHTENPDPLSDYVRKQIEENLHLLPDPIVRMFLICYFAAMRPCEIALLKQDCLVQEGQHWKLVWRRKKGKDQHEIPVSRTIAQVVQEQQEYIHKLWSDDWDYLFCHYRYLSSTDPSMPKMKPAKKVLPLDDNNPLSVGIRTLIKACDIQDENGESAKFQHRITRPTRLTELFAEGHDLAVVSAWAGHKQLATTNIYYTQVSCELMEREAGHIQKALVNSGGRQVLYESYPKSFWENPTAHKLELSGTHINTPIYGYCGLAIGEACYKFRACYTCNSFVATIEKLPQYINTRDELRTKQAKALSLGQEVLVEQFGKQADQLDKIIASLQQEAA
jgi:integrase/transcription elongation factor Elf1